jgi:hypothetical protein
MVSRNKTAGRSLLIGLREILHTPMRILLSGTLRINSQREMLRFLGEDAAPVI